MVAQIRMVLAGEPTPGCLALVPTHPQPRRAPRSGSSPSPPANKCPRLEPPTRPGRRLGRHHHVDVRPGRTHRRCQVVPGLHHHRKRNRWSRAALPATTALALAAPSTFTHRGRTAVDAWRRSRCSSAEAVGATRRRRRWWPGRRAGRRRGARRWRRWNRAVQACIVHAALLRICQRLVGVRRRLEPGFSGRIIGMTIWMRRLGNRLPSRFDLLGSRRSVHPEKLVVGKHVGTLACREIAGVPPG